MGHSIVVDGGLTVRIEDGVARVCRLKIGAMFTQVLTDNFLATNSRHIRVQELVGLGVASLVCKRACHRHVQPIRIGNPAGGDQ